MGFEGEYKALLAIHSVNLSIQVAPPVDKVAVSVSVWQKLHIVSYCTKHVYGTGFSSTLFRYVQTLVMFLFILL